MDVGHEIIKEQLFFRKELKERVYWFIKLRWAAAGAGLAGSWALYWVDPGSPVRRLTALALFIFLYNMVFYVIGLRLDRIQPDISRFQVFAHVQIVIDLVVLFMFIYLAGGLASPILSFVFFHIILAGILLPPLSCYIYTLVIIAAMTALLLMHHMGLILVGSPASANLLFPTETGFPHVLIPFSCLCAAQLIVAFLTTSIKVTLRFKGRELMKVSRDLDISNTRLQSLYLMIKEIGTHTRLQDLLDSATRNAALTMGVGACSIKLIDHGAGQLRFASTFGLSRNYLAKESIIIDKSPVNKRIIDGSLYSIGNVREEEYFQYPEDIKHEGIVSMLCLPLKVEPKTLGVFCVYSKEPDRFDEKDADFFSLMTDLTALAMACLYREKAKSWFMNKAAHQLRSPISTLQSMLKTMTGGYLGRMSGQQIEVINRCLARLSILQETIKDLLMLAEERREDISPPLEPIDLAEALKALIPNYQNQALEKGLDFDIRISENLPHAPARKKLIDDLFTNLISNAIKYTPEGGKITITLDRGINDDIRFQVTDTGIGIPEPDIPKLFTEFYRTENAKQWTEEGTGLGLVIVKEALDTLGGSIHVDGLAGKGTRITCHIPLASK